MPLERVEPSRVPLPMGVRRAAPERVVVEELPIPRIGILPSPSPTPPPTSS
jgi:hypothetical protein